MTVCAVEFRLEALLLPVLRFNQKLIGESVMEYEYFKTEHSGFFYGLKLLSLD
jgi:hypothetical protein